MLQVGPLLKELSALRRQNEALNRTSEGLRVQLRQAQAEAKAASQLKAKERALSARSKSVVDARLGSAAQRLAFLTDQVVRKDAALQEVRRLAGCMRCSPASCRFCSWWPSALKQ